MAEEWGQWISVKEKLPSECGEYLFSLKFGDCSRVASVRWFEVGDTAPPLATHWQSIAPHPVE